MRGSGCCRSATWRTAGRAWFRFPLPLADCGHKRAAGRVPQPGAAGPRASQHGSYPLAIHGGRSGHLPGAAAGGRPGGGPRSTHPGLAGSRRAGSLGVVPPATPGAGPGRPSHSRSAARRRSGGDLPLPPRHSRPSLVGRGEERSSGHCRRRRTRRRRPCRPQRRPDQPGDSTALDPRDSTLTPLIAGSDGRPPAIGRCIRVIPPARRGLLQRRSALHPPRLRCSRPAVRRPPARPLGSRRKNPT